jgi:CRP-like cAMP-binding protein
MEQNHQKNLFTELQKIYEPAHREPSAIKHYQTGQEIYIQGQAPKGAYFIKQGTVMVSRNNHEEPVVVRLAKQNEFIGYLSLITRCDYDSTATAIEPSEIYFIPKEVFLKNLETNPKFAHLVLNILCSYIHNKNELLTELLTKSVEERLATLLLLMDHNPNTGKIICFKKYIAAILNIKAETLSRNLLKLRKMGAIKLHLKSNSIEILNKQKLVQLARTKD